MRKRKQREKKEDAPLELETATCRPEIIDRLAIALLAAVGFVYTFHFIGFFAFPNSDFLAFVGTGRQWLSFQIPASMKRAPVFSIITVLAGIPFSGPESNLTGTEWFNALLLPVWMILIYHIGKDFLGRASVWVALLAGLNPYVIRLSSQPLAEITIATLFAATVLCVRRHNKMAYLLAMLCSLSRWDMAAILPAVAIVDLLENRKWKRTIALTLLASLPFVACMIITKLQLKGQSGGVHYLQVLSKDRVFELGADLKLYWQQICSFLAAPLVKEDAGKVVRWESANHLVFWTSSMFLAIAFVTGAVLGIVRRRKEVIVMLITAVPYIIIHAMYPYRLGRFCVPMAWVGLLCAAYGAVFLLEKLKQSPAGPLIFVIKIVGIVLFAAWACVLVKTLRIAQQQCLPAGSLVWWVALISVAGFVGIQILSKRKFQIFWLTMIAFLVLSTVSNVTSTGFVLGDGKKDANFVTLAHWFRDNAGPEDKLVTTMAAYMPMFSGGERKQFIHTGSTSPKKTKTFDDFIEVCRKRNITLIAWDSRLAGQKHDRYYQLWAMERLEILGFPYSRMDEQKKRLYMQKLAEQYGLKLEALLKDGRPLIAVYRLMPKGNPDKAPL